MRGFLAGYPMVDFKATVFDGSYHAVDSNELSFKMAGSLAFKDAMTRARPTILEPVMQVEVYAPSDFAGDLMGDLNGRRGRIAGMDTRGTMTVIRAQVPMSEMLTYEQHLTSATGGRGSYHMEYSHYEEVPQHLQAKIIAAAKARTRPGGRRGGLGPRSRGVFSVALRLQSDDVRLRVGRHEGPEKVAFHRLVEPPDLRDRHIHRPVWMRAHQRLDSRVLRECGVPARKHLEMIDDGVAVVFGAHSPPFPEHPAPAKPPLGRPVSRHRKAPVRDGFKERAPHLAIYLPVVGDEP